MPSIAHKLETPGYVAVLEQGRAALAYTLYRKGVIAAAGYTLTSRLHPADTDYILARCEELARLDGTAVHTYADAARARGDHSRARQGGNVRYSARHLATGGSRGAQQPQ